MKVRALAPGLLLAALTVSLLAWLRSGDDAHLIIATLLAAGLVMAARITPPTPTANPAPQNQRRDDRLTTFARVTAGIAHDLAQPIGAIRLACEEVVADPTDDSAVALLRKMTDRDLPRLSDYIADLRRIACEDRSELQLSEVTAQELAKSVADEIEAAPKWRGVRVAVAGTADSFTADAALLRRALFSLAANGADATLENRSRGEDSSIQIRVQGNHDAVLFAVTDHGPGIPENRSEQVLSGDFHSTKRSSGVGLGLGIAQRIALAHGGEVTATSDDQSGTTFILKVPAAPPPGPGERGAPS